MNLSDYTSKSIDHLGLVSDLYQDLSEKVVLHLGLPCKSVHLDSTSFHVDGEYDAESDSKTIRLTKGYSRDHRPDLNQVILNLITENQAGILVYMQACSGNTNDSDGFKKLVKSHVSSLKAAQRSRYLVADAALYVAETIQALHTLQKNILKSTEQSMKSFNKLCLTSSAARHGRPKAEARSPR